MIVKFVRLRDVDEQNLYGFACPSLLKNITLVDDYVIKIPAKLILVDVTKMSAKMSSKFA